MTAPASSDTRLRALLADRRFPVRFRPILLHFVASYRGALAEAGLDPRAYDHLLDTLVDELARQLETPFVFEPYHQQITEPFDYYTFGLDFLRPLVDLSSSVVQGHEHLDRVARQIAAGENVIFFANHQTEGDPQAISLLLEATHRTIGKTMVFVAGARVTTDPLAVPFSMGRNLLCIHSKRYIDHPPGERAAKQQHNRRTMERMSELLGAGGQCIYVAPSGGRDRVNHQGIIEVAPFDAQSVEMFYLMAHRAGTPTHFYPMALATYDFLPPPETVQVEIGEARRIQRTGIHLAIGAELDMEACGGSTAASRRVRRDARALAIWQRVAADYAALTAG